MRVADADPVLRVGRELARRIVLDERAEGGDRRGEVVAAEEVRGRLVGLHLARLVRPSTRLGGRCGDRLPGGVRAAPRSRRARHRRRGPARRRPPSRGASAASRGPGRNRAAASASCWFSLPSTSSWPRSCAISAFSCSICAASSTTPMLRTCSSSLASAPRCRLPCCASSLAQVLDAAAGLVVVEEARARAAPAARKRGGRPKRQRAPQRQRATQLLALVADVAAAVLRPGRLVVARRDRAFPRRSSPSRSGRPARPAAVMHLLHASARRWPSAMLYSRLPRSSQLPSMRILRVAMVGQVVRVRLDQRLVLVLDLVRVEVEVDAALGQDVVRIVQRIAPRRPRSAPAWSSDRPVRGAGRGRRRATSVRRRAPPSASLLAHAAATHGEAEVQSDVLHCGSPCLHVMESWHAAGSRCPAQLVGKGPTPARARRPPDDVSRCLTRPSPDTAASSAAAADLRFVEDHLAVGREAGRFVERAVGQHLRPGRSPDPGSRCGTGRSSRCTKAMKLAVGAEARRHVVAALEGQRAAPRRPPAGMR